MPIILVLDHPDNWPFHLPTVRGGVELVSASQYLTDPRFASMNNAKVFNLCRSYRYQAFGYYVSLLATARGHRPLPSIATIQDLRLAPIVRLASQDIEELIHKALQPLKSDRFEMSIYFGRNMAARYDRLAGAIFGQFPAPFLRATFQRDGQWQMTGLRVIGTAEIPTEHRPFVIERAQHYFEKPQRARRSKTVAKYDMAILRDEANPMPPSDDKAIRKFIKAGEALGLAVDTIGKNDYGAIGQYDALFIRETTYVNHYTFRFARRATAEGLVVIDDPESILRCTNKVYLAELLNRHKVRTPKTVVIGRENADLVAEQIGFPCVVKQPDSAFSVGVKKYDTQDEFEDALPTLFEGSELLLAQEFTPTDYDWRIGVVGGQPLYACRYFMAKKHWQIVKHEDGGKFKEGDTDTIPLDQAPTAVVNIGVKAAKLIGDGLYGVDIKEIDGKPAVIEVNDNPNIDAGIEDAILGDFLYERIMRHFLDKIESTRRLREG